MTSISQGNNHHMVGNHVDKRGSASHRPRQPDYETGPVRSQSSSSRPKARQHGREDPPPARSRDEVEPRRRSHEVTRSRHDSGTNHDPYVKSSTMETPRRRSSRHYENDLSGSPSSELPRNSERRRSASSHRIDTDMVSSTHQRRSGHRNDGENEPRRRERAEYQQHDHGDRRYEEQLSDRSSYREDRVSRSASHRDCNGMRSHSNQTLRRSSSREHGDSENERQEYRSHRQSRGPRSDEERENHQDTRVRHRSSSAVRDREGAEYSRGHRHSSQIPRDSRSDLNQDSRTIRRPSRSECESGEERRERRSSRSEARTDDVRKQHKSAEPLEVRSVHKEDHSGQNNNRRGRSTSMSRDENRYDSYDSSHSISHSRHHSSSKQSLAREEKEAMQRSPDPRACHEHRASKSRHASEHRQPTETPSSRRRNAAMSDNVDDTTQAMKQTASFTDINYTKAHQASPVAAGSRQRRPSPQEENSINDLSSKHNSFINEGGQALDRSSMTIASRRRSVSSHDEQDGVVAPTGRHDVSLSRRSSSSRSNQDTGFASSSSSPRRDDSQSRFSSDVSPSHFREEEGLRSRVEESRRKRRSRMMSNNSLDVPGGSLMKEQSLSSSGRGDSSFEEPLNDHSPNIRRNRLTAENLKVEALQPNKCEPVTNNHADSRSDKLQTIKGEIRSSNSALHETLAASKNSSRSSSSLAKGTTDSPKNLSRADIAEWASSTSTLRGGNATTKTSIAGSISSLLGRGNKDQQEENTGSVSVSERWRRLKQGILPDANTEGLTGRESAAAIFSAAAAKFMSSLPRMPNTLNKSSPSPSVSTPAASETSELQLRQNDSTPSLAKTDLSSVHKTKSEISVASRTRSEVSAVSKTKSDASVISQIKANDMSTTAKMSPPKVPSKGSSNHSMTSLGGVNNPIQSQRPSIISTTLSSHNKRANVYAVMTEKRDSPDSEESGEMTPPPLDDDMKRRSKEVDQELTSFLPAEMSRREEKFHDAARVNDADAIRSLLKERVNVNCRNSLDRTALHWAAANGNLEAAEALIEHGADLEAKDKYGMRAVLWAAWFGHISVLKALVNAGANTRVTNKQGLGMLHCAAENNHVSVISFIFEALEPHDVNQRDKNDRTPLQSAAESGHVEAVRRLLEAKADINKKDKGGMTAVHLAAKHGHIEVLKKLLLQGVEVDDRDVDGKTALHLAAEAGFKEAVDLLLDYTANPNSETVKEVTPLHMAAQEGHVEVCRSLVKCGCNVNAQNFQGNSALHIAANGNHKEVARVLVDAKCELDLPNTRMQTSLHVAVESGHLDVVQILLAGGASLETREKSGKSALQLAARGNYVAVVDMLIKAERYYANTREYHDKDVGYVDPDTYLRKAQHPHAPQMKDVLWKLAMKQLKPADWKKLAYHWHFTPEHVRAIEQEYTGTTSYKEHSYRLLNIWLHGVRKDENVLKLLFEALVAIDRKQLAESVRRKVNLQAEKPCSPSLCLVS